MDRLRSIGLAGAVLVAFFLVVLDFPATASAIPSKSVRVTFVLAPTWLPTGYSATGDGWVTPEGGLRVYPKGQVSESRVTVGSVGQTNVPVLFTLDYYGFHNPESKSIRLTAAPEGSLTPQGATVTVGHRHVTLAIWTQGVFHNIVTAASWEEHGDDVVVMTQGLTTSQVRQFIGGLEEHKPPRA